MARRASTVSTTSLASFHPREDNVQSPKYQESLLSNKIVNGHGPPQLPPRTSSLSVNTVLKHQDDTPSIDPDQLFAQRTITEVKAVQVQLRADADAKQEELRLMVGERYRDLLQASTSIISIARSSKRVVEALEETKGTILAQDEPPLPKRASLVNKEDAHLQTLQLLSAHIKLLLDAPEHLWRLIERKMYFQAAWLFLLARVVHRALVRDDDQDEESWGNQGIDVMEQFPLIQRQWDAVSHFRTQIIHKATLSLRLYNAPSKDTCATLLTLHLLDSRPLAETLSMLLSQRTKAFHALLDKPPSTSQPNSPKHTDTNIIAVNGHPSKSTGHYKSPKRRIREVRHATEVALDTISRTLKTARDIFQATPPSRHSMAIGVLEYIQSDSPSKSTAAHTLPPELMLTTQTLLTTLPSSAHFLLLPANLRSYKPYVDLNSPSSSMPHELFIKTLDEWFKRTSEKLQDSLETWFSGLESAKEVWRLRSWIRKWVTSASRLDSHEQQHFKKLFDESSRRRMIVIWKSALAEAEKNFRNKLDSSLSDLMEGSGANAIEVSSVEHLFAASALPSLSQTGTGLSSTTSSLEKYKSALQRQKNGRTASLDILLSPLEDYASALQHDFSEVSIGDGEDTRMLAEQLRVAYRPDAEALCSGILDTLEAATDSCVDNPGDAMASLAFIGRVADELSSTSPFLSTIGCGDESADEFQVRSAALNARITSRWRKHVVSQVTSEYWVSIQHSSRDLSFGPSTSVSPSTALMHSLISLSTTIQHLGISRDPSRLGHIASDVLRLFVAELLTNLEDQSTKTSFDDLQILWDLAFLRKLASVWDDGWNNISGLLDKNIILLREKLQAENLSSLESNIADFFSRTQVLIAALLPVPSHSTAVPSSKDGHEKLATLMGYGIPVLEKQFHPALELAKPSSRFGLLLVGSTTGQ